MALNGGPRFVYTEAVSFVINFETQDEIDDWEAHVPQRRGSAMWLAHG